MKFAVPPFREMTKPQLSNFTFPAKVKNVYARRLTWGLLHRTAILLFPLTGCCRGCKMTRARMYVCMYVRRTPATPGRPTTVWARDAHPHRRPLEALAAPGAPRHNYYRRPGGFHDDREGTGASFCDEQTTRRGEMAVVVSEPGAR
jgi:hypothetical protein